MNQKQPSSRVFVRHHRKENKIPVTKLKRAGIRLCDLAEVVIVRGTRI